MSDKNPFSGIDLGFTSRNEDLKQKEHLARMEECKRKRMDQWYLDRKSYSSVVMKVLTQLNEALSIGLQVMEVHRENTYIYFWCIGLPSLKEDTLAEQMVVSVTLMPEVLPTTLENFECYRYDKLSHKEYRLRCGLSETDLVQCLYSMFW